MRHVLVWLALVAVVTLSCEGQGSLLPSSGGRPYEVLLFAAAYAVALEVPAAYAGTLLKEDLEVDAVALDVGADLHVGEVRTFQPNCQTGA